MPGQDTNEAVRPKTIVGMPAYNEGKYVGSLILLAKQHADEVIVIDDGSSDRTAKIAELAGATVIRHRQNKGYGAAIQTILAEAKKRSPDILVILDADSQHNPEEIPLVSKAVSQGFDVVIGSRRLGRGSNVPPLRRIGQNVLSRLTSFASRKKLTDTESGFRAFSRKAIATLELREQGMAISAETIVAATARGLRVTEVPISVTYTEDGSTMNPVRHGLGVLNRVLVMISERKPLLFFGAVGGIFIALGIAVGVTVLQAAYIEHLLDAGRALLTMLLFTIGMLSIFTAIILDVLVRRISGPR